MFTLYSTQYPICFHLVFCKVFLHLGPIVCREYSSIVTHYVNFYVYCHFSLLLISLPITIIHIFDLVLHWTILSLKNYASTFHPHIFQYKAVSILLKKFSYKYLFLLKIIPYVIPGAHIFYILTILITIITLTRLIRLTSFQKYHKIKQEPMFVQKTS